MNTLLVSGKAIAVLLIAVIIITGVLGVTGKLPLPKKASLISVSQVNLESGGTIQNGYLIGSYWNIAFTVNSLQNIALLNFGGSNHTTAQASNGQTVTPTSQIYVTISPGQPYATVPLKQEQITWAPGASGLGCGSAGECSTTGQIDYNYGCPSAGYGGASNSGLTGCLDAKNSVSTNPQTNYFFTPAAQYWTYHFPVTITAQKVGGGNSSSQIDCVVNGQITSSNSCTIDMASQGSVLFENPSNHNINLTINKLGNLGGDLSQVPVGNYVFYDGGSKCPSGICGFQGYSALQDIQSGFSQYWFGGAPPFSVSSGATFPEGSYSSPGWGTIATFGYGSILDNYYSNQTTGYFYYPTTPSLTSPQSSFYYHASATDSGLGHTLTYDFNTNVQSGLDLTDWLESVAPGVSTFANPYCQGGSGCSLQWSLQGPQDQWQSLSVNLPYSEYDSVLTPVATMQISTSLVDTVLYQVNAAQFSLGAPTAYSSSATSGGSTTISVNVQNTGSYSGTATVSLSQSVNDFSFSPPSASTTLAAGASSTLSFQAQALATSTSSKDLIQICVSNDANEITDCKSITLTDNPAPSLGSQSFTITGINIPGSVSVGSTVQATVNIQSLGAEGIAYLNGASEDNSLAIVAPPSYNQSMGAGNTVPVSFTVTGVSIPNGQSSRNVTLIFSVQSVNGTSVVKQVVITVTSGPCFIDCGPGGGGGTPWYELWETWVAIGVVTIASLGGFLLYRKH